MSSTIKLPGLVVRTSAIAFATRTNSGINIRTTDAASVDLVTVHSEEADEWLATIADAIERAAQASREQG